MVLIYKQFLAKKIFKCYENNAKYYKSSNICSKICKKLKKGWDYV